LVLLSPDIAERTNALQHNIGALSPAREADVALP